MNFDKYKFHCSSLGKIMTESRTKEPLGETCKGHLLECWIYEKYGRFKQDDNKFMEKGTEVEEDSISLYSKVTKTFYKKNTEIFENEYITGTPDIIHKGTVIDIKSSWSIHTFFATIHKAMNKDYLWQLNGYSHIVPGIESRKLVYTLINTPGHLVENEKSKLRYKMGVIDPDASEAYQSVCEMIDKNSYYDDIPEKERYIEFEVPEMDMEKVYERIEECRNFLNQL